MADPGRRLQFHAEKVREKARAADLPSALSVEWRHADDANSPRKEPKHEERSMVRRVCPSSLRLGRRFRPDGGTPHERGPRHDLGSARGQRRLCYAIQQGALRCKRPGGRPGGRRSDVRLHRPSELRVWCYPRELFGQQHLLGDRPQLSEPARAGHLRRRHQDVRGVSRGLLRTVCVYRRLRRLLPL